MSDRNPQQSQPARNSADPNFFGATRNSRAARVFPAVSFIETTATVGVMAAVTAVMAKIYHYNIAATVAAASLGATIIGFALFLGSLALNYKPDLEKGNEHGKLQKLLAKNKHLNDIQFSAMVGGGLVLGAYLLHKGMMPPKMCIGLAIGAALVFIYEKLSTTPEKLDQSFCAKAITNTRS